MGTFSAFVLMLQGCEPSVAPLDPPPVGIPAPFVPVDDVEFVDAMSAHHRATIEMTTEELERGADPEVVALADEIRAARRMEFERMQTVRQALTRAPETPIEPDVHLAMDMHVLRAQSGADLDQSFLEELIGVSARALDLAHRTRLHLDADELYDLAQLVESRQAREIGQMRALLDRLEAVDPD